MYYSIYETAKNSAGSAMEENEKYMQSLQARINQLRSEFEQLAVKVGESFLSEGIVNFTRSLGKVIELTAKVADSIGALPIVLTLVGGAILLVNTRFRLLFAQIATGKTTVTALAQSFMGATTAAGSAAIASRAFLTVLRGFAMATGIGAALIGVGMALEFVSGKMTESRERSEELKRNMKDMTSSFKENRQDIKSLVDEISNMEQQMASGAVTKDQRADFSDELIEKRNRLAELMPQLKRGEDEYGNAILEGNGAIQSRIALSEKQLETQEKIAEAEERTKAAQKQKDLEENTKLANKELQQQMQIFEYMAQQAGKNTLGIGKSIIGDIDINSIEDVRKVYQEITELRNQAIADGDTRLADNLNSTLQGLDESLNLMESLYATLDSFKVEQAQISHDKMISVLEDNEAIDLSARQLLITFSELLAHSDLTGAEIEKISNRFRNALQHDEQLQQYVTNYQNSMLAMEQAKKDFESGKISEDAYFGKIQLAWT